MNCKITENYLKEKRRMIVDYEKDCGKPLLNFEEVLNNGLKVKQKNSVR